MNHRAAATYLPDYAAGSLSGSLREELSAHLEVCEDCRGWLDVYRILSAARPVGARPVSGDHVTSELLARYAVDPDELSGTDRGAVAEHLRACRGCREELELARSALLAARPGVVDLPPPDRARPPATRLRRLALAAGIVAMVVGTLVLYRQVSERADSHLSGIELGGAQVVQARRSMSARSLRVESGARITLRAGEVVVLGEGFEVGPDADLTIEVGSPD